MRVLNDPNELTELVKTAEDLNDLQKCSLVSQVTNPIRSMLQRIDNYSRLTGRNIAPNDVAELRNTQKQLENIVAEKAWNSESRAGTPDSGLYSALEGGGDTYAMAGTDGKVKADGHPKLSSPLTDVESVVAPRRQATGNGVDNNKKRDIIITDEQFGKKIGKHAQDWNLDASKAEDRERMKEIIYTIVDHSDEVRHGNWRSQPGTSDFYIKGDDVVVKNNGKFVTILKGGINNERVKNARK